MSFCFITLKRSANTFYDTHLNVSILNQNCHHKVNINTFQVELPRNIIQRQSGQETKGMLLSTELCGNVSCHEVVVGAKAKILSLSGSNIYIRSFQSTCLAGHSRKCQWRARSPAIRNIHQSHIHIHNTTFLLPWEQYFSANVVVEWTALLFHIRGFLDWNPRRKVGNRDCAFSWFPQSLKHNYMDSISN
jgi:hypothetical protein